jgi:hypothetical protein
MTWEVMTRSDGEVNSRLTAFVVQYLKKKKKIKFLGLFITRVQGNW